MGRKNTQACVYMLRHKKSGLVYIGETSNFKDRMSAYKSTKRKYESGQLKTVRLIDDAIVKYGFDAFEQIILCSTEDMEDLKARLAAEARFIRAYRSTDPKYGYNMQTETQPRYRKGIKAGVPTKTSTKILKGNPIVSYEIDTGEMFIWLNSKDFADELNVDRAQVARSTKNGLAIHGHFVFMLDREMRHERAKKIIDKKSNATSRNGIASKALKKYKKAYKKVEEFCEAWGN